LELEFILILLALGVFGGFLSGLLGVGGGIIFVPVFDFVFRQLGIQGEELVRWILANSFLAIMFSGMLSTIQHRKRGFFEFLTMLSIAIPAMISGSLVSNLIAHFEWYSDSLFKLIFISVLGFTLWRSIVKNRKEQQHHEVNRSMSLHIFIGVITGIVSALSGLGGGVAMIPLLTLLAHREIKEASAISIGVIPMMVIPFLVSYAIAEPVQFPHSGLASGYLSFTSVLPVAAGIALGAPFGVRSAHRMANHRLQTIFAILLLILMLRYGVELLLDTL